MGYMESLKRESLKDYIYVIIYTIAVYLTIPFARSAATFLSEHGLLKYSIYFLLSIFIITCCCLIFKYIGFRLLNIISLAVFFPLYISIIQTYDVLAEKIHFIEYGVLAFLLYRALKKNIPSMLIYPVSLVIVFLIGWGDELIQYFLPERVYEFRDVLLNVLSGGLILALIFLVEKLRVINNSWNNDSHEDTKTQRI